MSEEGVSIGEVAPIAPIKEAAPTSPASASPDLSVLWAPVRARLHKRLLGAMTTNLAGSQRTEAERAFRWAIDQQLRPADVTQESLPELHARFVATLDDLRGPNPKRTAIRYYKLRTLGKRVLEEVLLEEPPEPVLRKSTGRRAAPPAPSSNPPPSPTPEVPVAVRDNEEEPELIDEGDEGEDAGDEPPVDEVRPSRRPPRRAMQQPVFVVQPQAPRRALPKAAPPRSKLLSTPEKIRLYKRGIGGKRILVNDYTTDDIGNMSLHVFIKDFVDPEFGDPSGLTTYEAVSVNPVNDRDTGTSSSVTIESTPQPEHANSPIGQVRDTISLLQEMQDMNAQKTSRQSELLAEAQKSAVGKGDLSQLMVLMLLDKFQNKSSETPDLLKVVEMLQRQSAPPAQSLANLPSMPAYMPPPLPPPQPSALDKVLEVLLTNMMKPLPPQPTFLEQMMQFQQMQQMMGGGAVATQLAALQHKLEQPKAAGGIEESLTMFEKLSAAVKTLAPQLNMGGLTGALQTIITPELGKALGGVIAQGIEQRGVKGAPGVGVGAGAPTISAPPAPPARPAVDPVIVGKVQSLRIAQTPPVQVQATIDLVQAMWMGPFKAQLDPVLGALLAGDVGPARAALQAILADARADLATPAFVDDVLRAMAAQTGQELPAALKKEPAAREPVKEVPPPPVETAPPPAVQVVQFPPEEPYVEHQPSVPKPKPEMSSPVDAPPRAEPVLAVARG